MRKSTLAAIAGTALLVGPLSYSIADSNSAETYKQLGYFADAFATVRGHAAESVSDEKLVEGALKGMLASSIRIPTIGPEAEYKDFSDDKMHGEFGGLGFYVDATDGLIRIVSAMEDTPASRANLKAGDIITRVDGEPVGGDNAQGASDKMRGAPGTSVKLTIQHGENGEPYDVMLTREIIKISSVTHEIEGNDIGYIRLSGFTEQTQPGLEKAIADIKQQLGPKLAGYVLDLRDNPGGLLNQAVSVSNSFLDRGEIVSTRGRDAGDVEHTNAKPGLNLASGIPLVVLINAGSASASGVSSPARCRTSTAPSSWGPSLSAKAPSKPCSRSRTAARSTSPSHGTSRRPAARSRPRGLRPTLRSWRRGSRRLRRPNGRTRPTSKVRSAIPEAPATPGPRRPWARPASRPAASPPCPLPSRATRSRPRPLRLADAHKKQRMETDDQLARAVDLLQRLGLFNQHS